MLTRRLSFLLSFALMEEKSWPRIHSLLQAAAYRTNRLLSNSSRLRLFIPNSPGGTSFLPTNPSLVAYIPLTFSYDASGGKALLHHDEKQSERTLKKIAVLRIPRKTSLLLCEADEQQPILRTIRSTLSSFNEAAAERITGDERVA